MRAPGGWCVSWATAKPASWAYSLVEAWLVCRWAFVGVAGGMQEAQGTLCCSKQSTTRLHGVLSSHPACEDMQQCCQLQPPWQEILLTPWQLAWLSYSDGHSSGPREAGVVCDYPYTASHGGDLLACCYCWWLGSQPKHGLSCNCLQVARMCLVVGPQRLGGVLRARLGYCVIIGFAAVAWTE
jgi:hypothetical protein